MIEMTIREYVVLIIVTCTLGILAGYGAGTIYADYTATPVSTRPVYVCPESSMEQSV